MRWADPVTSRTSRLMARRLGRALAAARPMPRKSTIDKGRKDEREGKSPSTQAGEFVHEEMDHIRQGKHGASSPKQAIAIGLSKARRAGVKLPPPRKGTTSERTRHRAEQDVATGSGRRKPRAPSPKRSRATSRALKRRGRSAASPRALSRQAKQAASRRRRRGATTESRRPRARGERQAD